jgi:Phage integrase family
LRHTHASILIAEGVDIVKIAVKLGHANPKITLEVYAHLMPNEDNEVADIFHNAFKKSREQSVSKSRFNLSDGLIEQKITDKILDESGEKKDVTVEGKTK